MRIDDFNPRRPADLVDPDTGWVSRRVFTDPDLFSLELERVFAKSWLFVGLTQEVAKRGDYVTRVMGDDPVILSHGQDGQYRVFLNACPHRGALVCRADRGNSPSYTCPYHGWTFQNTGKLHAAADDLSCYKGRVDFAHYDLVTARTQVYGDLVFATFDDQLPPLEEYLGDARWYLDMFFDRTPAGLEVLGAPVRWRARKNWKYGAINFAADGPHALAAHGPITRTVLEKFGMPAEMLRDLAIAGPAVRAGNGHGMIVVPNPPGMPDFTGFPPECVALYREHLKPGQIEVMKTMFNGVMTVFPNMSWVHFPLAFGADEPFVNFFNLRVWQPVSASETEIWSWFLADKEASEEYKQASLRIGVNTFTAAGTFDQDDSEAWAAIDAGSRGTVGKRMMSSYQMILASEDERIPNFPGPGEAYNSTYSEMSEFGILLEWRKRMEGVS